jgi:hypothetical protein
MRIVMIGNFQVSYCTEQDWAWTYEHLGHEVIRCQENETTTEEIWSHAQTSDLVHYVHTHGWVTPGVMSIAEILERCNQKNIPTVGVHLDYWRGLEREQDVGTHPWWKTDFTFTADGGSNDWYRSQGINHHYLKAGVVERDCYLGEYREEYACDVAFVGSYHYHPEWSYRPRLIDWLQETYGDRFRRYAGDTKYGTIRGKDLNDLYASVKVVVGDTLCIGFDHPDYFSDRVFETTGRGGFLIFPEIEGIKRCFNTSYFSQVPQLGLTLSMEKELQTYRFEAFDELKNAIDYYLQEPEMREAVRLAGHERTKRDHTYTNRVLEMFEILKQEGAL